MTKQEYLAELRAALSDLSAEEASRACAFYEEMIDDRMEAGEDERDAVAAMEPPAVAASRIVDEIPAVPRALARAQGGTPPSPRSPTPSPTSRATSARRASTPRSRSLPRDSASEARPAVVALT